MAANHHRPITKSLLSLLLPHTSSLPPSSQPHPPPLPTLATTNPSPDTSTVSPALSIFIVAFIGVFILLISFFIYIRFCVGRRPIVAPAATALPLNSPAAIGLDPALLASFPTIVYSDVKHPLECAVCLSEFEGRDALRLIPSCGHVFHRDCIDVWLGRHVTCPVCRRNLSGDSAAVDREIELADLVRIGSERRGANSGSVSRGDWEERFRLELPEDVRRMLGRSASSPAGREKDGRVWFRLSGRDRRDLDGKGRVGSDGGDDSKV